MPSCRRWATNLADRGHTAFPRHTGGGSQGRSLLAGGPVPAEGRLFSDIDIFVPRAALAEVEGALRLPPLLLARHLSIKAWKRMTQKTEAHPAVPPPA